MNITKLVRTRHITISRALGFVKYGVLFFVLSAIYEFSRYVAGPDSAVTPLYHASNVVDFERALGLLFEPRVQALVLAWPLAKWLAVELYKYEHLAGSILFLSWLYFIRPRQFPFVWRWFWVIHLESLVGFWLFPLAPPRLVPALGLSDPTAVSLASTPGASAFDRIRNEFAAMPSLHVGYPLLFALVLWWVLAPSPWRWCAWLWPMTMFVVVVATGNHFWLDAAGGALVVGLGLAITVRAWPMAVRPWNWRREPVESNPEIGPV